MPADVIPELIGQDKPILNLRYYADSGVLSIVLKVFQSLLSIKNMPLLEEVYRYDITIQWF